MTEKESKDFVEKVVSWIDDKKGIDTKVINLEGISILADDFVITSAGNERQVTAIAEEIEEKASEQGIEPKGIEGKNSGRWILMDYGDVVIHVFHEEDRAFYDLERLWKDGDNIEYRS